MSNDWFTRLTIAAAGILGATGIMAAAAASHAGDERILGALALIALTHAPALLAIGLLAARQTLIRIATTLIGLGALIFCADLAVRHFTAIALFPMSAPIGGSAMILGWALLVPAAFMLRRQPPSLD
jgi:uncharacterized membrane protein YgdD (TMEM256/DUF423 family)